MDVPWHDLESGDSVRGWYFAGAYGIHRINGLEQIAGYAQYGDSVRAAIYYEDTGYALLPRLPDLPDMKYWIQSSNEYGEVQGFIQDPLGELPGRTFLWSPDNPSTIRAIDLAYDDTSVSPKGIENDTFMTNNYGSNVLKRGCY